MVNPKSSCHNIKHNWPSNVQACLIETINKQTINSVTTSTTITILTLNTNSKYIQATMLCADGNPLVHFKLWLKNSFTKGAKAIIQQIWKLPKPSFTFFSQWQE